MVAVSGHFFFFRGRKTSAICITRQLMRQDFADGKSETIERKAGRIGGGKRYVHIYISRGRDRAPDTGDYESDK